MAVNTDEASFACSLLTFCYVNRFLRGPRLVWVSGTPALEDVVGKGPRREVRQTLRLGPAFSSRTVSLGD